MTESITLLNPNLGVLCQEATEHIINGYRFKEGYPMLTGWMYEAQLEKSEPIVEVPKQVGRPPKKA